MRRCQKTMKAFLILLDWSTQANPGRAWHAARVGSDPIFLDIIPIRSNSSKVDLDPIRSKIWKLDLSPIQIRSRSSWYPFDPLQSNYYPTDPLGSSILSYRSTLIEAIFNIPWSFKGRAKKWAQNSTNFLKHNNILKPMAKKSTKLHEKTLKDLDRI